MDDFSDSFAEMLGEKIAFLLLLKKDSQGFYNTAWGKKTTSGLGRTVQNNYLFVEQEAERAARDIQNGKGEK